MTEKETPDLTSYQPGKNRKILTPAKVKKSLKAVMLRLTEEEEQKLRGQALELGHKKLAPFIIYCLKRHNYI